MVCTYYNQRWMSLLGIEQSKNGLGVESVSFHWLDESAPGMHGIWVRSPPTAFYSRFRGVIIFMIA